MSMRVKCLALALILVFTTIMTSCDKPKGKDGISVDTEGIDITEGADSDDIEIRAEKTTLTIYFPYISKDDYKRLRKLYDELEKRLSKTLNLSFDIRSMWDIFEVKRELGEKDIYIYDYDRDISAETENALLEAFFKLDLPLDLLVFAAGWSFFDHTGGTQLVEKYIAEGRFMDITDLLPSYASRYISDFSQDELESAMYYDRLYYIPKNEGNCNPLVASTSKKLTKKYGIEKIETLEDLSRYIRMVEKENAKLYPVECYPSPGFWEFLATRDGYVLCDGYMVYRRDDPEMKLMPFEETEAFRNGALFLNSYPVNILNPTGELKAASYVRSYVWDAPPLSEGDSWLHWPLYLGIHLNNVPLGTWCFISSKSQHAKEILQLIDWLNTSPDSYLLLNYGFEGTDYTIEKGEIVPKTDWLTSWYLKKLSLPFKSEFRQMFPEKGSSTTSYNFNSYYGSSFPPHNGFSPSLDLRAELIKRNKAFLEMGNGRLSYGSFDINEFKDEMKRLDTQYILKKFQDELDQWRRNR